MTINFNDITDTATPSTGNFSVGGNAIVKGSGNNLYLYSSSLTNAAWTVGNLTVTGGQTDPFNGTTAALLTDTTTPSVSHSIRQIPSNVGSTYTLSVYAKAGTSNYIGLANASTTVGSIFNLTTGAVTANWNGAPISTASTNIGNGWWRLAITLSVSSASGIALFMSEDGTSWVFTGTGQTVYIAAPQYEVGTSANPYVATSATAVYGTPSLSFSGAGQLGLQSDGSLYVQPAGTGALQAQATTSSATGGNARGTNAVDWQTVRSAANRVASATSSFIGGGYSNQANAGWSSVVGGYGNSANGIDAFVGGGETNIASGLDSAVVNGGSNTAAGYFNFIGGGWTNSGTSGSTVTTQSGTMNATTAVTLSGSNASIKVGQLVTGTSIANYTYVAAVSGTSLTLSQAASGSSTNTLFFYTPHGAVVAGGNNQATGSYSFVGGGGDAGTSANGNVASGDWSVVAGGRNNIASGLASFIGGGGTTGDNINNGNTASGIGAVVVGGTGAQATNAYSSVLGGQSNRATGGYDSVLVGQYATTRAIQGNCIFGSNLAGALSYTLGASQSSLLILGTQTTDATATILRSSGGSASTNNQVILPNNSAYYFRGEIISGVTGGGNTKGWYIEGVIKRGANAASTALVGTPTVMSSYADVGAATWAITLSADTTNGGLSVTFTGQASTTIRTVAQISTTEMTY